MEPRLGAGLGKHVGEMEGKGRPRRAVLLDIQQQLRDQGPVEGHTSKRPVLGSSFVLNSCEFTQVTSKLGGLLILQIKVGSEASLWSRPALPFKDYIDVFT